MLTGQGFEPSGERVAGGSPVDPGGRFDGLAAPLAGQIDAGLGPPDPGPLAEGEETGLFERGPGRQDHPDAAQGADRQADPPGPPALDEQDGPDALERDCSLGQSS